MEENKSFEQALDRLQALVKQMESGQLSLEDSLKSFEEGVQVTQYCQSQLKAAEQRVLLLTKGETLEPLQGTVASG